jgi:hypothetical protein
LRGIARWLPDVGSPLSDDPWAIQAEINALDRDECVHEKASRVKLLVGTREFEQLDRQTTTRPHEAR